MFRTTSILAYALISLNSVWASDKVETVGEKNSIPAHIEFNRDIRPILSNNCFFCHGPDKDDRKSDLRLDTHEGLLKKLEGGMQAVTPGDPNKSELLFRVLSTDHNERMPPPGSGKELSTHQIALLKRWVEQGAPWEGHWSYLSPKAPELPALISVQPKYRVIDHFIHRELERQKLPIAPEADRVTLIRRLSFDLLGLPPDAAEVDAFVNDPAEHAYEKLVDRLLQSRHFGERMAVHWLDLVRYADSSGYHSDCRYFIHPYRDYVIEAFNRNKPFNIFTVEQIAGDLLPNAGQEQKIASGYNRLLQTTAEGGAQAKEYLAKYAADRIRTTSTVWLGATMGCAECHDHKYDPYSMRDFYSFGAFFADVQESGTYSHDKPRAPVMHVGPQEVLDQANTLDADANKLGSEIKARETQLDAELNQFIAEQANSLPEENGKSKLPENIAKALQQPAETWDNKVKNEVRNFRFNTDQPLKDLKVRQQDLRNKATELRNSLPLTMISVATKPRTMRILPRGNWLDETGEIVSPRTPDCLPPIEKEKPGRLDLANWLVSSENPLTARVFVNRLWKLLYGVGLSKVLDDLGSQGEWPTHPELLDWLALEFMSSGWDVKHMVKLMTMTESYRRSSRPLPVLTERDPFNRYHARQARFRLNAEFVRDNALSISGLLNRQIGGASVKPYQPDGYWDQLNFPKRKYVADHGMTQYRRGVYTHWQRSFLHPSMVAFDAPSREECCAERPNSNTPLQALVLLNDPIYVEAALAFADEIRKAGNSFDTRLQFAFKCALSRTPSEDELKLLQELFEKQRSRYAQHEADAKSVLKAGQLDKSSAQDPVDLAAWNAVARTILNLHEAIMRY